MLGTLSDGVQIISMLLFAIICTYGAICAGSRFCCSKCMYLFIGREFNCCLLLLLNLTSYQLAREIREFICDKFISRMSKHITTCPKFPSTLRFTMSPGLTVKTDEFLKRICEETPWRTVPVVNIGSYVNNSCFYFTRTGIQYDSFLRCRTCWQKSVSNIPRSYLQFRLKKETHRREWRIRPCPSVLHNCDFILATLRAF